VTVDEPVGGPDSAQPSGLPEDLVRKRLNFVERMRQRKPGVFDVAFEGLAPAGTGPPNRHGLPRLPAGQHEVRTWPVLDLGVHPHIARADWRLEITGQVLAPRTLRFEELLELPQVELESDFHCVTTWSFLDARFGGVRLCDLMELVVPASSARFVYATAYDADPLSGEAYSTNLPLERALDPDVLLVHTWNGAPLPREHGGPLRMVVPRLYAWKGAKWLRGLELLAEDRPGFWERRGYSSSAEPWFEDRFSGPEPPPGFF
jgi:DMSO/TMAO reductase YedYZ molybdopterin-dependent catalytic subunit